MTPAREGVRTLFRVTCFAVKGLGVFLWVGVFLCLFSCCCRVYCKALFTINLLQQQHSL